MMQAAVARISANSQLRLAIDQRDLPDADDAQRDEQQDAAERSIRDVLQQPGTEGEQRQHDRRRRKACELRMSAGLGDDAGARRAGIDRKRAENSREHAARAGAEEVAVDIGGLPGI